jgi:hypothetical protein
MDARAFDDGQERRSPVAVVRLADRLDGEALRLGTRLPFEHRRGMIVFQNDDASAAGDG